MVNRYWLVKTEPSSWSWRDQVKKGVTHWDGVRNYQAANNLKQMKIGDQVFFYHSVTDKSIQGIVEVVKESYPDPSDTTGRFVMVDLKTVKAFTNPVPLDDIKNNPTLSHLALVKQSRLSVMPVDEKSWKIICQSGGI
ncbi:MAG: EVE domain-containing protein [Alphaproteobacteria bacterium]|nr:EVE domain-containing protein [Alphaproteobacteria bacterium]OJV46382.1 MAG: ubiquinol-cytochrome C reductase [Alphaproteobacteria bacterium 43-37]